jgi:hypothetical protein
MKRFLVALLAAHSCGEPEASRQQSSGSTVHATIVSSPVDPPKARWPRPFRDPTVPRGLLSMDHDVFFETYEVLPRAQRNLGAEPLSFVVVPTIESSEHATCQTYFHNGRSENVCAVHGPLEASGLQAASLPWALVPETEQGRSAMLNLLCIDLALRDASDGRGHVYESYAQMRAEIDGAKRHVFVAVGLQPPALTPLSSTSWPSICSPRWEERGYTPRPSSIPRDSWIFVWGREPTSSPHD